jgi:hypothetical protein
MPKPKSKTSTQERKKSRRSAANGERHLPRSIITKTSFGPDRKELVAGGADPGAGLSAAGYKASAFS